MHPQNSCHIQTDGQSLRLTDEYFVKTWFSESCSIPYDRKACKSSKTVSRKFSGIEYFLNGKIKGNKNCKGFYLYLLILNGFPLTPPL